jgi:hypothetical protein
MSRTTEAHSAAHAAIIEAMQRVAENSRSLPDEWRGTQLRLLSRLLMRLPTPLSAQEFAATSRWLIGALARVRRADPALAPACRGLEEELREAIDLGWEALPGLAECPEDSTIAAPRL